MKIGHYLAGLLSGYALLVAGERTPTLYADSAPILTSAAMNHTHVVLTVTHATAHDFSVWVSYQDVGGTHEGFIKSPTWKRLADGQYDTKVKIPGATNVFRVSVAGATNLSNAITVIP